jgi:hypothetical protein
VKVGTLEIELFAEMARLTKDMRQAERVVGNSMANIEAAAGMARRALEMLGVGLSVGAFALFVKNAIDTAAALNQLSQRTGIASEELSQLQYAAKLADVAHDSLNTSIKKLNISIAQGKAGDQEKIAAFRALGITTQDLGRGTIEVMFKIADAYSKAKDGAGKVENATKLMGRGADEMIPLLNQGGKAIRDLMEEADRLGLTISADFAEKAKEFNDNLLRVHASGQKLAILLATDFVDGVGKAMKVMADATIAGGKFAGVLAFIQTLFTGTDLHKANVALVEDTDKLLQAENALSAARASGMHAAGVAARKQLVDQLRDQIKTTQIYRASLIQEEDAQKAAGKAVKDARENGKEIAAGNLAAAQAYEKLLKPIQERIDAANSELALGRQLTEAEKFEIKALADLEVAKKKISPSQQQAIKDKIAEAAARMTNAAAMLREQQNAIFYHNEDEATRQASIDLDRQMTDQGIRVIEQLESQGVALRNVNEQTQLEGQLIGAVDRERSAALALLAIEQKRKADILAVERDSLLVAQKKVEAIALVDKNAELERQGVQLKKDLQEQIELWGKLDDIGRQFWSDMLLDGTHALDNLGRNLKKLLVDEFAKLAQQEFKILITPQVGSGTGGSLLKTLGGGIEKIFGLAEGSVAKFVSSAVPILGGALAVGQMLGLFKHGGPKTESGFGAGVALRGDPTQASGVAQSIQQQYAAIAAAVGVKDAIKDLGVFFAADPQGTAQTQLEIRGGSYARSSMYGGNIENVGRSDAELQSAIALASAQLIVKNLQEAATGKIGDFLKSFDVTSASLDQLTGALAVAKQVGDFDQAVTALGGPFKSLVNLSIESAQALSQLTGAMVSFISDFATDAEKSQYLAEQISSQLSTGGLATSVQQVLDMSRDQYKAAVLAAVAAGDAGAKTLAALLSVEQAFNQLHPVLQQAAVDVTNLADMQAQLLADSSNALMDAYHREADALQGVIDKNRSYVAALKQLQQSLTTGPLALLSPQAQYDKTREDFMRLAALPANSDERLANLPAVSRGVPAGQPGLQREQRAVLQGPRFRSSPPLRPARRRPRRTSMSRSCS